MFGPIRYTVLKIDGDYAHLLPEGKGGDDTVPVARALLPPEIDEGSRLLWENLAYTLLTD